MKCYLCDFWPCIGVHVKCLSSDIWTANCDVFTWSRIMFLVSCSQKCSGCAFRYIMLVLDIFQHIRVEEEWWHMTDNAVHYRNASPMFQWHKAATIAKPSATLTRGQHKWKCLAAKSRSRRRLPYMGIGKTKLRNGLQFHIAILWKTVLDIWLIGTVHQMHAHT